MPKRAKPLTESEVRSARAKQKAYTLPDGNGLYLQISKAGLKTWVVRYRLPASKTATPASIGYYPAMSLANARVRAIQIQQDAKAGKATPGVRKAQQIASASDAAEDEAQRRAEAEAERTTLKATARRWLADSRPHWAEETYRKARLVVERYLVEEIGDLDVRSLQSKDVRPLLLRMVFGLASALVAAAVQIGVPTAAAAELDEGQLVGTYEVIICRGPCSFSSVGNAVIEGNFVLLAKGIEPSEANRLDMFFERALSRRDANGCYNLRRLSSQKYVGYANTRGPALTVWSLTNGELHLSLFRSTDAGYEAVLRENAGTLSGTGQSWGAGVAEPQDKTTDHIIARRVGAAEIRTCGFEAKRYLQAG